MPQQRRRAPPDHDVVMRPRRTMPSLLTSKMSAKSRTVRSQRARCRDSMTARDVNSIAAFERGNQLLPRRVRSHAADLDFESGPARGSSCQRSPRCSGVNHLSSRQSPLPRSRHASCLKARVPALDQKGSGVRDCPADGFDPACFRPGKVGQNEAVDERLVARMADADPHGR